MNDHASRHELIAKVAYQLWESKGRPIGTAESDWHQAEHIVNLLDSTRPALASFAAGPDTGAWAVDRR